MKREEARQFALVQAVVASRDPDDVVNLAEKFFEFLTKQVSPSEARYELRRRGKKV